MGKRKKRKRVENDPRDPVILRPNVQGFREDVQVIKGILSYMVDAHDVDIPDLFNRMKNIVLTKTDLQDEVFGEPYLLSSIHVHVHGGTISVNVWEVWWVGGPSTDMRAGGRAGGQSVGRAGGQAGGRAGGPGHVWAV